MRSSEVMPEMLVDFIEFIYKNEPLVHDSLRSLALQRDLRHEVAHHCYNG